LKIFFFIPAITALAFFLNFSGCPGSQRKYPLKGTEWKLETLNGKSAFLKNGKFITLNFEGSAEKLNGTAVCNKYFGEYINSGESLRFTGISSTKMMCDDTVNEHDYYNVLSSTVRYKISDGKLRLIAGDSVMAVFTQ
jgi:heat shock protein HslJ